MWAGATGGTTNGLIVDPNGITRNGNVGGSGTSTEIRNIQAVQSSTDVSGTTTTTAYGTIRLNYTV
jgi:hypothetical protein